MKRILILLISFILFCTAVPQGFSVDIGGSIANTSTINGAVTQELTFIQQNRVSLWFNTEFKNNLSFVSRGSYLFSLDKPFFLDLDYIILSGGEWINYSLGRLKFSDFSGLVLNHTLDGACVRFFFSRFTASVSVGYSGLVQMLSSSIIMTESDLYQSTGGIALFGAQRLIEIAEIEFIELFLTQDVTLCALMQQDLRKQEQIVTGDAKLSSQYFGAGISGPVFSSIYHDVYFYLGTGGYQNALILSFLGGARLRIFIEQALFSRIQLGFLYSSGDSDQTEFYSRSVTETSKLFAPISRPTFGYVFSPQLGNIWLVELDYSVKPLSRISSRLLRNIQTSLKGIGYFRSTTGAISEDGIDPDSNSIYLGTELDTRIGFRPLSDLGAAIISGVFIPNSTATSPFVEDQRDVRYLFRMELSVSF